MSSNRLWLVGIVSLLVVIGLGWWASAWFGGSSNRASVSGRVTIDGQPLKEGAITFIPEKPNVGPTAGGFILDGNYQIDASQGPVLGVNRVEIRGAIRTGRKIPDRRMPNKEIDEVLNVPARYHSPSEFTRDLTAGSNNFDFELQSK